MPGAWVFVAEHVPARRYGFGVSTLTSGITGGILLGSLVAVAINKHYSPAEVSDFAWRIPFILGGVFGLVSVYLRRFLHETPVFRELADRRNVARELPLKTVLREHRAASVFVALLTWVLSAAIVVVVLYTPTYLQKVHHVPATLALEANAVATLMLTLGCILVGWATDRIGTRAVMLIGWGGLLVTTYLFYTSLPGTPVSLVWHYGLVGLFVGTIATVPIAGVRAFPAPVRFTGLSFAYNMSYAIFGGLTPIVLTLWLEKDPMAPARYVGLLAVLGFVLGMLPLAARGHAGFTISYRLTKPERKTYPEAVHDVRAAVQFMRGDAQMQRAPGLVETQIADDIRNVVAVFGIALDDRDSLVATGRFRGGLDLGSGALEPTQGFDWDGFVARVSPNALATE